MSDDDLKFYYGVMNYGATGEGTTIIIYMAYAPSPESFKAAMIEECHINEYFHIGIEVFDTINENTPKIVFENYRLLKNACFGYLKFELVYNYS